MNSIEVDNDVLTALSHRAIGFHVTPNDVIRSLLNLPQTNTRHANNSAPSLDGGTAETEIVQFIRSERFRRNRLAVDRFLGVLTWLHTARPKEFAEAALGFHRGKRTYFARSEKEITQSGEGITAKPIPQSPFWVLTTLDNKSKRTIIEDLLHALNYEPRDINVVLAELPDSDIRRRPSADELRRKAILDQL